MMSPTNILEQRINLKVMSKTAERHFCAQRVSTFMFGEKDLLFFTQRTEVFPYVQISAVAQGVIPNTTMLISSP